jgi:1-acyl-sn-glycerol-3-phosphate acyltransferase
MSMGTVRAVFAVMLITPVILIGLPVQWVAKRFGLNAMRTIPLRFHRFLNRALGVRRIVRGTICPGRPLLLTPNHASWLDITVLSAVLPVSFVSKAEVGTWPLIGTLARMQRTVFVDRNRRSATGATNAELAERLAAGDIIALFAEGTSGDGTHVLPFRSALLGAATASGVEAVWVQPVAITYSRLNGLPLGRSGRFRVAWYGEMNLAPHLWGVLKAGAIDVIITFGEPVRVDATTDRKRLAREAEASVRRLHATALRGRPA